METNKTKYSLCIFCLKSATDFDYTHTRDQYKFFTLIVRHFLSYNTLISADDQGWCRNACKVISEITINGDDNEPFFENVKICRNCEGTTRKFSDLYKQMKEIEMRIDWEVDTLWNGMGNADKTMSRLDEIQLEKTFTNGGVVTLAEFRNTLKQSCKSYLGIKKKKAVLNVQLTQITEDKKESASLSTGQKDDIDFKIDSVPEKISTIQPEIQECPTQAEVQECFTQLERDDQNGILAKEVKVMEQNDVEKLDVAFLDCPKERNSAQLPLSVVSKLPEEPVFISQHEEDPLNPLNNKQSNYICSTPTCSLTFTSKFELFQHNMANHIGKYFLSVQSNSLSSDQFNNDIFHLLEATLEKFYIVDEKNYKCPFCSNQFLGRQKARNHLVVKHRPILKQKLVEAPKPESFPPEILETTISTTDTTLIRKRGRPKGQSGNYCFHCSKSFPNKWVIFQHDIYKHPEKYFMPVKLEILTPHQFHNCVVDMLRTTVNDLQILDSKYQCNFCTKLLSVKSSAKIHLVRKHLSVLKEKLVEVQKSSDVDLLNTSRRTNNVSTSRRLIRKKRTLICNICKKGYHERFELNRHQRQCHPEIFFEGSNLLPSSSSESNEQFKTYVRYVLEKQRESLFSKEGHQIKCDLCSRVLNSMYFAENHLISKHRSLVAEKLEELQKSGNSFHEIAEELLKLKGTKILEKKPLAGPTSDSVIITASRSITVDCSVCSVAFKNNFCLFQHSMHHHPEKYFSLAKLESTSNEKFKEIVIHLLNNIVDDSKKSKSNYTCPFCPKLFCGRWATKNHLVKKHHSILQEKLVELQNSGNYPMSQPTTSANISANDMTLKRKRGWPKGKSRVLRIKRRCKRRARQRRVVDHVPVFRRQRVSKLSKCGECGNRFANEYTLRTHMKGYCKVLRQNDNGQDLDQISANAQEEIQMDDTNRVGIDSLKNI